MQEIVTDLYDVIIRHEKGEIRSDGPMPGDAAKKWAEKQLAELDDFAEVEYRPSSQMRLV